MITVGIDEVGRGCWAGPLVAAAVILPSDFSLEDCPLKLRDSKKLSKKQREIAAQWVQEGALAVGLGWVWPVDIDSGGITRAVKRAMRQALAAIQIPYDEVIIDGNINYLENVRGSTSHKIRAVVKADDLVPAVSAASIVAKVARDKYMAELGEKYAGYGFDKHVGYGTAAHIAALQKFGVSDIHRRSFKPIAALLPASS
jgi:ribonuclease HII